MERLEKFREVIRAAANARLRAALDDELAVLAALRAEAARLEAMAKKGQE